MASPVTEFKNVGKAVILGVNVPNPRKLRILLAACGTVAATEFGRLCQRFCVSAEVKAVATKAAVRFIDTSSLPMDVKLYVDEEDWSGWRRIGGTVLHIELRRWADALVIAPLSANTLAKIAGGVCDNMLTCLLRAWDYQKPLFLAPDLHPFMWSNPFTEKHLLSIDDYGIIFIPPADSGDDGTGAMARHSEIYNCVRVYFESRAAGAGPSN